MSVTLSIATDFSRTPGSRYEREGEYSGEVFRRDFLYPKVRTAVEAATQLTINLDGTAGFGTSFLEEAFGGLIRENGVTAPQLRQLLRIQSDEEPYLIEDIWTYVDEARPRK